ncbi:MAG: lipopolysaccharide biosynthesis protein [Pseudomonadota bacterium]|nr:lipopolysaccharide biosynthesis protein [Pseudomonadota bacterium]
MKNLRAQSLTALFWGTGGSIARMILQLAAQVVLARILGPAEYGLFALGVIVVGVSTYFSDIGLAYGLIQKKSVSADDIRFVWTWQCLLGILISSAIFFSAGTLAGFFAKPEAEFIFRWLSLVVLINAVTAVSVNLLKKELNYKPLQLAQLFSYFLGFVCIGIPLAAAGYGGASLVVSWLVQSGANLVILYWHVRHPLTFKFWITDGRQMLSYGLTVLGTNLVNWVLNGADKMLVGRIFPAYTVGLYTTAFNLVNSPSSVLCVNLSSVVFSACARLQDNHSALREVFLRMLSLIILVSFPLFVIIAVGSEFVITAIYGAAWVEAAQFLTPFALAMPFFLVWCISTPILWNSGHTKLELWLQLPLVFIWLAVLYAVANSSSETVAIVAASLFAVRCIVMVLAVGNVLRISPSSLFRAIRGGIVLTLIMAVISILLKMSIAAFDIDVLAQLFLMLGAGVGAYLMSFFLLAPVLVDESLGTYIAQLNDQLPRWAKPIFKCLLRERKK